MLKDKGTPMILRGRQRTSVAEGGPLLVLGLVLVLAVRTTLVAAPRGMSPQNPVLKLFFLRLHTLKLILHAF